MLISHEWFQSYFPKPLPKPEELARLFTFHAFEVEGMETKGKDTVYDIKILPDRAHYCLCHRGIVGEISAITGAPVVEMLQEKEFPAVGKTRELKIKIEDPKLCRRYIGRVVENVSVSTLPDPKHDWLKTLLEAIGQRSINTVVDSGNFVMFDIGQPLHAFDADKVKGSITIRLAKGGEKITTLDNKDVTLGDKTLVIADEEGPIAIAGVKGGKRCEVTTATKNLILESANFDPVHVRKTSARLGIKTDASKRFENEITPDLANKGMDEFSVFVKSFALSDKTVFGEKVDVYPSPVSKREISFDISDINRILGIEIPKEKILELFSRLEIKHSNILKNTRMSESEGNEVIELTIPAVRLDLQIPEDIVEEIGRLYGYENISPAKISTEISAGKPVPINKNFFYQNKIRQILTGLGYTEVYTYAFGDKGEVELENPLASDKAFMRKDLSALQKAVDENALNAPLIGITDVKIFEIGKVFTKEGEKTALGIGIFLAGKKKRKEMTEAEFERIGQAFKDGIGAAPDAHELSEWVMEGYLDDCISKLSATKGNIQIESQNIVYKKPSPYPFIVRDVALFVPTSVTPEEVSEIIKKSAGDLVVKGPTLFDTFEKGDKKSLAFRMVFQSYEKTLTDDESNKIMEKVYSSLKAKNWEIR